MKFLLTNPMYVFVRVKGPNGAVRELKAVLDFNSPYCVILSKDGVNLGFAEAAVRPGDWQKSHPDRVPYVLDFRGIERSILLKLPEVSIGRLTAREVGAIVIELDLPRLLPVELIVGRSFLSNFRLTVDWSKGYLSLTKPSKNKGE